MQRFACYEAVEAKLHVRRRDLLDAAQWEQLLDYTSVDALHQSIKALQTPHDDKAQEGPIHRERLEYRIERYRVGEIEKIIPYFSGPYKTFFKTFLLRYDTDDLQRIFKQLQVNESLHTLEDTFLHSKKYTTLPYKRLLTSQTLAGCMQNLKKTPYEAALKHVTLEDSIASPFHLEMKLDSVYYGRLLEAAKGLRKRDRLVAETLIKTHIDLLNIQWIARATHYPHITKEEILVYSLGGGGLGDKQLKMLIYEKDLQGLKQWAQTHFKGAIFDAPTKEFLTRKKIDAVLLQTLDSMRLAQKARKRRTIVPVLTYIYALQIQTHNLIAVTEGVRYRLSKEQLRQQLVVNWK